MPVSFVPTTSSVYPQPAPFTTISSEDFGNLVAEIKDEINLCKTTVLLTDFGADPTGVDSSLTAFDDAVAYVIGEGGGTIIVPDGTYLISGGSVEVFGAAKLCIRGESTNGSIILNGNTNLPAIRLGENVTMDYGNEVSCLTFAGATAVTGVSGQCGLAVYKQGHARFKDLKFTNSPSALYNGLIMADCSQVLLRDNEIQNCSNTGFVITDNADLYVSNMRSDANGVDGVAVLGCQGLFLANFWCYGNTRYGWNIGHGTNPNLNNFFTSCGGDTNGDSNWIITDLTDSTFTSCWGCTQTSAAVNTGACGFYLSSARVFNIEFIGGSALYNNANGVYLADDGVTGSPTQIRLFGMALGSAANGVYSAAHPNGRAGTGYGLQLTGTASATEIGCYFGSNASGALSVASGSTLTRMHSDELKPEDFGCVGDGVTDDTTNFQKTIDAALSTGKKHIYLSGIYKVGDLDGTAVENLLIEGPGEFGDLENTGTLGATTAPYALKGQLRLTTGKTLIAGHGLKVRGVAFTRHGLTLPATTPAQALAAYNGFAGIAITADQNAIDVEGCAFYAHNYPAYVTNSGGGELLARLNFRNNIVDCQNGPYVSSTGEPNVIEGNYCYPITTVNVRATVTMAVATPGKVTHTAHGFSANQRIIFETTGALLTGITAGTIYYVRNPSTNDYEISATSGGGSIAFSGVQSGVHKVFVCESRERSGYGVFMTNRCTRSRVMNNLFFGFRSGVQLGEGGGLYASGVDFHDNHLEMPPTSGTPIGVSAIGEYASIRGNVILGYTYPIYADGGSTLGNDALLIHDNRIVLAANSPYAIHVEQGYLIEGGNFVQGAGGTHVGFDLSAATYRGGKLSAHSLYGLTTNYSILSSAKAATFIDGLSADVGGTQTQSTSKSTTVVLNGRSGQITMNNAALNTATTVSFTLTNSAIAAGDVLILNHISGGTAGAYTLNARSASGSATIDVRNITGGSLSEAIVIAFSVIKATI